MLRVIAGKYRSRKLKEVKKNTTRPTTDKNKESLFNSLGQFFSGGKCLDLFAGSGALGIEAYSRGFEHVTLIEKDFTAYKIIKANIESLQLPTKNVEVILKDVFAFLEVLDKKYDLIIIDPPYALDPYAKLLEIISSRQLLNDNGIIVMESGKDNILPEKHGNLIAYKQKISGISKFTFYQLEADL